MCSLFVCVVWQPSIVGFAFCEKTTKNNRKEAKKKWRVSLASLLCSTFSFIFLHRFLVSLKLLFSLFTTVFRLLSFLALFRTFGSFWGTWIVIFRSANHKLAWRRFATWVLLASITISRSEEKAAHEPGQFPIRTYTQSQAAVNYIISYLAHIFTSFIIIPRLLSLSALPTTTQNRKRKKRRRRKNNVKIIK